MVRVNNAYSAPAEINTGIPQGSIVGATFFKIMTNDMHLVVSKGLVTTYMDDATVVCSEKDNIELEQSVEKSIENISNWCKPNQQVLNPSKMAVLPVIGSRSNIPSLNIEINGSIVAQSSCHKLLGVVLDEKFKFQNQIEAIRQKIIWQISILRTLAPYCNENTRLLYYESFIYPHFNFCSTVWSLKNKEQMNMLLLLQKQAIRLITHSNYLSHTLPLFLRLKIIPIVFQFKINKILLAYKAIHNIAPDYLANSFQTTVGEASGRNTREAGSNKLHIPPYEGQYSKSFNISAKLLWNSVPQHIRECKSIETLKKALRDHVLLKISKLTEINEIWCSSCSIETQFNCLFCSHFN